MTTTIPLKGAPSVMNIRQILPAIPLNNPVPIDMQTVA